MQITAHAPVRRVLAMAWTAAALTAIGPVAALRHAEAGWLGPASLIAALVAWGFMILLPMRLQSVMVHNAEGYASLFERHPQPIIVADNATLDVVAEPGGQRQVRLQPRGVLGFVGRRSAPSG